MKYYSLFDGNLVLEVGRTEELFYRRIIAVEVLDYAFSTEPGSPRISLEDQGLNVVHFDPKLFAEAKEISRSEFCHRWHELTAYTMSRIGRDEAVFLGFKRITMDPNLSLAEFIGQERAFRPLDSLIVTNVDLEEKLVTLAAVRCECGGKKANTTCAAWCPRRSE